MLGVKSLNEKDGKTTKNKVGGGRPVIWAGLFLVLMLFMSVANIKLLLNPIKQYTAEEIDFKGLTAVVHDTYVEDFLGKYYFVNINGAYMGFTGKRIVNGVIKLNNGMLTDASMPERDIEPLADNIIAFSNYLAEQDIPFLYVQAPFKIDNNNLLLPAGRSAEVNISVDSLLTELSTSNVNALDLRSYISETPEMLERYFNKTDHHWNYTGAFVAFQQIVEDIQNILPEKKLDLTYADMEQWESHLLKNWFLGSRGKRVGMFFTGVDDIVYYTPKFTTYMSCAISKHSWLYKGDFADANIRSEYLDRVDYFGDNPYCLYIGGDYPLVQHRNDKAPNDLKILIIKDSFNLPVQAYMSTLFKEVDVIDPRHFTECSVVEYVQYNKPDMVIMMINPSQFGGKAYHDFGVANVNINKIFEEKLILNESEIKLPAKDNNYNYAIVADNLQYGKTYAIRFNDVDFMQGESNGVTVSLYNPVEQTIFATRIFDVEYCRQNGRFEWIFNTPASGHGDLQLLLYSGLWRATAGVSSIYTNISLSRLD